MECIKIIHIGDVHYPDSYNKHIVDMKDKGIDKGFIEKITPNPFERVSKEIIKVIKSDDIKGILLSGDLTTRGNLAGYESCVSHFLSLFSSANEESIEIHVVPGNHDLDREIAISGNPNKKFDKFVDVWVKHGANYLLPNDVRKSSVDVNGCKMRLYSLNTCVGCGEIRRLPDKNKIDLEKLLKEADLTEEDNFDLFCEQLDTPAANQEHIDEIEDSIIAGCENSELPVVLAHHGLLPQSTVRIDIYTEMINGGHVRSILDTIECSILYCHGHIHKDPVEVIRQPKFKRSNLISISAPEFCDGFNLIEIYFSTKKVPLGCVVRPYRFQSFGSVREDQKIPIKLTSVPNIDDCCHEQVEEIYKLIPAEEIRFIDLCTNINTSSVTINNVDVESILKELNWIGVIVIENIERNSRKWTVRRVGL